MITKSSLHHRPKGSYTYATDFETLQIRLKTARGEVNKVTCRLGDPFDWKTSIGGNLLADSAMDWVGLNNYEMKKECETKFFDHWIVNIKPEFKRSKYLFILESTDEQVVFGEKDIITITDQNRTKEFDNIGNFFTFPFLNNIDVFRAPKWVEDAIFYQIFPERFDNGDPSISPKNVVEWGSIDPEYDTFYGGDIQGVINRLDYLGDLGITAIYFCPIFESPSTHKYDTIDYTKIDPHFGTNELFRDLVIEAHARGIRVMIDAVFNHIGFASKQWQDVLKNGENSIYKDWFHIRKFPVLANDIRQVNKDDINYDTFAFAANMPKLNTENKDCREYLLDIGRMWVRDYFVDGWRLDVAVEVDHSFWRDFRKAVKEINPECYILGEAWHDTMPWLNGDQFDATMNYPLTSAVLGYLVHSNTTPEEFKYAVNNVFVNYPEPVNKVGFNMLDSHDTSRIITLANGNIQKVKLAYLFQFTMTGAPCIYYGGEIGLDGGADPLCRKCMIWDENRQDLDLKQYIKDIIRLRKKHSSFRSPDLEWIETNQSMDYIIYKKISIDEMTYIIINNSNDHVNIDLPHELHNRNYIELFSNNSFKSSNVIELDANCFVILKEF